jgi:capsular exopolysaccharide synthesis family protein
MSPLRSVGATVNGHRNGQVGTAVESETVAALLNTPIDGLLLLPSGPAPLNPSELLGSRRMTTILAELSTIADVIIVDSPPLLPVTDAAVLATKCDTVVLVTAANETPRSSIRRSMVILDGTRAHTIGVVLNKAARSGNEYYYAQYYAGADPSTRRRKSKSRRSAKHERRSDFDGAVVRS